MSQPTGESVPGPAPSNSRFILWALLLVAMIAAIFYDFSFLSERMGTLAGGRVAGLDINDVGAGIIVALEVFMGLFFLESRGTTANFPVIHALKTPARTRIQVVTIFLLSMYALIGVGLVWMADAIPPHRGGAAPNVDEIDLALQMAIALALPFLMILAPLSADRIAQIWRGQPS